MKVLLVTKELGYRGTPRALEHYAHILSKKHNIYIWGYESGGEAGRRLTMAGFKVYTGMKCFSQLISLSPSILNIHRAGITCKIETEILREFKAIGCRCIETNVFGRVDWDVESALDLSIQISRWDLYRWNAWKGNYKVPGVYFPNPVNVEEFQRAQVAEISHLRHKWLINELDENQVFVLGRIGKTKWKWLSKPLLRALERFPNLHFVNVLDYCGETMPDCLLEHPRVHNQERLVGVTELVRFYSSCDACVSMSWNGESFGYVNAEPLACGTPVIALSTPFHDNAQVEMVGGKDSGGIVIGRSTMLGDALGCLISSFEERSCKGKAARKSIVDRYSDNHLAMMLLTIFEKVVSNDIRESLRQAADDGLVTMDIPYNEITKELRGVVGGMPFYRLLAMRLYHSYFGYKIIGFQNYIKKLLRR